MTRLINLRRAAAAEISLNRRDNAAPQAENGEYKQC
jgi:hypothetical protein